MNFAEWRELAAESPQAAARKCGNRMSTCFDDRQHSAVFAEKVPEAELEISFASSISTGGPLAGVPYALKDLFDVTRMPTRAGSSFLEEVREIPSTDSHLVNTLRQAGAIIAAKTHLHEFAYGLTGENIHYGNVERPGGIGRTSGGSSSGSAAAVAAGALPFAIGTDTGGSIRVPAAFCGLYGFRMEPHHAYISDAFPLAPSFDTAGWFTSNAADMGTAMTALIEGKKSHREIRGCYMGFSGFDTAPCEELEKRFIARAEAFAPPADSTTRAALLSTFTDNPDAYNILQSCEALAVHKAWLDPYQDRYSPGVWKRIERARHWSDQQIAAATRTQVDIIATWKSYFETYDFLILPVAPFPALEHHQCTDENRARLLRLTRPVSLAGLPALTIPFTLPSGLSSGLQVIARRSESCVFPAVLARDKQPH